jgi:hypothetical protein
VTRATNPVAKACGPVKLNDQRGLPTRKTNETFRFKLNGCTYNGATRTWWTTEYVSNPLHAFHYHRQQSNYECVCV